MTKEEITFQIELEKYIFELKYAKDFKGVLIWLAGILVLLVERLLSQSFQGDVALSVMIIIILLSVALLMLSYRYLYKRSLFLERIQRLRKHYYETLSQNN